MANFLLDPEKIGRRRFPDNKSFRKILSNASADILGQMQPLLASNYPKEFSTNLNIFNKVVARELARINLSMGYINQDKDYTLTRVKYLQQILGERLLLGSRIAPIGYNDETYREYLLAIKSADLKGSKKNIIETLASEFTGQDVSIKELYLDARRPYSSLTTSSANKMVVQVLIEQLLPSQNLNTLKDNLDFFINLTRPAHVLYDTQFIWTEQIDVNKIHDIYFGDTGGGCIPYYDYSLFEDYAYLAMQVFVQNARDDTTTGIIDSLHYADYIFYLNDSRKVITEPGINGTKFYDANGHEITLNDLQIGDIVRINYQIIPGDFQFWWYPSQILTTPYSQFYRDIYRLPLFQETVKKRMDAQGRFPVQIKTTPTTICDRWVQDVLYPQYEDLRKNCNAGHADATYYTDMFTPRRGYPKLAWPFYEEDVVDSVLLGNDYVQIMDHTPITDSSSNIAVKIDGTSLSNAVKSVDSSAGRIYLQDSTTYWEPTFGRMPLCGDEFTFNYHYLDGTAVTDATTKTVFGVSYWQLPKVPVVLNNSGKLADKTDVSLYVDGTQINNAILNFDPILGHITLSPYSDFWVSSDLMRIPIAETAIDGTAYPGDIFKFVYKYGENFNYPLIFDDPSRLMDTVANNQSPYGFYMDCGPDYNEALPDETPEQIGYRWRAYLLHHSCVLNSPDTLNLNTFQKPANRASIANKQETLNNFNTVFSGEFLTDTSSLIVLDDAYLSNGLEPILKLNVGTPTFQQTFANQPKLIYQKKLQDIRRNHRLLLYSDLLVKEFVSGNSSVPLSSICDSNRLGFKIRISEEIPQIKECSPWILFDTVDVDNTSVSIPGHTRGVPNLRVSSKKLRENFILREVEDTGTALFTYSFMLPIAPGDTTFNMPATYKFFIDDEWVDFPTLPIVDLNGDPATTADITCTIDGEAQTVLTLNPTTGVVTIADYHRENCGEIITLTQENIDGCECLLAGYITDPSNIAFTVVHGPSQFLYKDFKVIGGRQVTWYYSSLNGILEVGDKIQVTYSYNPVNVEISFTYHVIDNAVIPMIDREDPNSRIMDDGYVFGGLCYDGEGLEVALGLQEFYTFLDDNSDGIKISFFNKDTLTVEEHIFSGPVLETYSAADDEIGVPDNFPNALVRIQNPLDLNNPLNYSADYGFLNDALVRFRKKTYRELLPDQSFRKLELVEMLPV